MNPTEKEKRMVDVEEGKHQRLGISDRNERMDVCRRVQLIENIKGQRGLNTISRWDNK